MSPNTRTIDRHATCHIVIIFHIMVYAISRSNCFYRKLVNHSKSKNTFKDRRNLLLFSSQSTNQEKQLHVRSSSNPNKFERGRRVYKSCPSFPFYEAIPSRFLRGCADKIVSYLHSSFVRSSPPFVS